MRWTALLLLCLALPAGAGALWEGLAAFAVPDPEPELPPGPAFAADGTFLCERAIRGAEARHGVPEGLLLQIGLAEAGYRSGVWPWTVNIQGRSKYFDTKEEATRFVAEQEAAGFDRIDTGCLQINRYWHPDAFPDLDAAFEPERNADYAARFLRQLRLELGSWDAAVGAYHSRNPQRNADYRARVAATQARARDLMARMAEERFALVAPAANLLPALSANLDAVDVVALARMADAQSRAAALSRQTAEGAEQTAEPPETRRREPLPDPKPGQGHALFAIGGGALFPERLQPLYE